MGPQIPHHIPGYLRPIVSQPPGKEPTDRELLDHFVQHRDADAFAVLLHRHAPMVLGVCRRLLRDTHAAEDAFQATFLVLARRAGTISWRDAVGDWLYQVASRTAHKAAAAAVVRKTHERAAGRQRRTVTNPDPAAHEVYAVLDEELERLPPKYRRAVVLCCLEGSTLVEAARQLGWPLGTLASRLARGRELLRGRLTRRGFLCVAAMLAVGVAGNSLTAAVPPALQADALRTALQSGGGAAPCSTPAARLARGVGRDLARARLGATLGLLLCLGLLGTTVAAIFPHCAAPQPAAGETWPHAAGEDRPAPKADPQEDGSRHREQYGQPLLWRHANLIPPTGVWRHSDVLPGWQANRTSRPLPVNPGGRSSG
jgi:RNA polymerase sigma factor (sigma-70 family)